MLTKLGRTMDEQSKNFRRYWKYKAPSRNHKAKNYNNLTKKHNRGVQQQTRQSRKKEEMNLKKGRNKAEDRAV